MFKINKCFTFGRLIPKISNLRSYSCNQKCPPRYECKRPEPSRFDEEIQGLLELITPSLFVCKPHKDSRIARNIFLFICLPTLICFYFSRSHEVRKRPKFVELSHLRIRNKEYVWDPVRTLFHNPRYNALPTGYEIEVPEEEEYDPLNPEKQ